MNPRILYAEDNEITRELTVAVLEAAGLQVDAVGSGAEACAAFGRATAEPQPYALVLLDFQMPEMNGHEVARFVKAHPDGGKVPVVLLTGSMVAEREGNRQGLDIAATLLKPVTRKRVAELLALLGRPA